MITLHQYPGVWGLSSLSPFCIKVEVFLKMAGLPYEIKTELNPTRGPKGKMPFIKDGKQTVADSSFILEHLIQKYELHYFSYSCSTEKARFITLKHMVEESLYFLLLHSRWLEGSNFQAIQKDFIPLFPKYLGRPVLFLIQRNLKRQAHAQGIGRHSQEEINRISSELVFALSTQLGEQKFFFGDRVTVIDATVYSFLITIIKQPFHSFLKEEVSKYPNLVSYMERITDVLSSKANPT